MRGSSDLWCYARPDGTRQSSALPTSENLLAQFSIRVAPQLLERSRVAASQLGLRRREIAATAIDRFLADDGFCA